MGLLTFLQKESRTLENPSTPLSAPDDWLYGALGAVRSSAGINVNRETVLTYGVFWRCVNLLSDDFAKLPLAPYKILAGGGKQEDRAHPAYRLVEWQSNEIQRLLLWK